MDPIEEFDYGKFVHIMDIEWNKIELWEPIDSVFTQMRGINNQIANTRAIFTQQLILFSVNNHPPL